MEHDLVVEGKVVLPGSIEEAQIGIRSGVIAEVKRLGLKGARTVRAGDCLVFPGFIDSHVHLREPGWEHKEDFRTGTRAAAHGGVTTVIDMPNNPSPATTRSALIAKRKLADSKAVVDVRFFGGLTDDNAGDISAMRSEVVGFKGYLGRTTGGLLLRLDGLKAALPEVKRVGKPLCLHCEDQSIIDERTASLGNSKAPDAHCDARPPEAEIASVRSAIGLLRRSEGVRANICHVSTGGALAEVTSAGAAAGVRCEAALHHLYFNRGAMFSNPLLRTNPPLRSEDDRRAVLGGLTSGRVSSLVSDHAPHTLEEKASDRAAGVPGLDDYSHVVSWLLKEVGMHPLAVSRVCSENPASFYGLEDRGSIAVGKRADLTIMDMKAPEKVTPATLSTKCGWSPYEGQTFPGRARWTMLRGELLVDDSELTV